MKSQEAKIREFVQYIQMLSEQTTDKKIIGFEKTEKEIMKRYLCDVWDLIEHNESVIGLENLLNNLYEIHFKIDKKAVGLAKIALQECGMNYEKWKFIEELVE